MSNDVAITMMLPPPRAIRAHELKNCLSVIHAISHLIEGEVTDRGRERLSRVRDAVKRMSVLINEDLTPDELPASGDRALVSVEEVVRCVVGRLQDAAERAGVTLSVECGYGKVHGCRRELAEALYNLVSNAIGATPAEGTVRVMTAETEAGDQEWIVQDTGCGMDDEVLANIGRPFYSRRLGGSGLGVAVVRETVRRHGGSFAVASEVGIGTTVRVVIPRAASPR